MEESKIVKVTLDNGIEIEADKEAFNDMNILELMVSDNPLDFVKVVEKVLSKEAKAKLYSSVTLENGRVPVDKFGEVFKDLMNKLATAEPEVKN